MSNQKKRERTIQLTLDNLSYTCTIKENEEVEIILPCYTLPDRKKLKTDKKPIILKSANPVKLGMYFINETSESPKITLTGSNADVKIDGQVELKPNSSQAFEFVTVDGGLNWLVDVLGGSDLADSVKDIVANSTIIVAPEI